MIDHGQAQVGKVGRVLQAAPLAGDNDWQVVGIGGTEAELGVRCLEGVGAAQQVDMALAQRGDGLVAAVVASHFDGNAQLLGDNARVISAQAFVVALADIDFERRVVGPRTAQHQALALLQPLPVFVGQRQWGGGAYRAGQQLAGLAVGQQRGGTGQADGQKDACQ
ncbi:hypothetical protein D3C76_826930 [compost metagenome]